MTSTSIYYLYYLNDFFFILPAVNKTVEKLAELSVGHIRVEWGVHTEKHTMVLKSQI